MDDLKHRLKAERVNRKLLQIDLANKLNVTKQTVSHWETGQRIPDALTIRILADFFNVSADYLLCRTDKPSDETDETNNPEIRMLLENVEDLPLDLIHKINQLVESIKLYKPSPIVKPDYEINYSKIPERLTINKELILSCK